MRYKTFKGGPQNYCVKIEMCLFVLRFYGPVCRPRWLSQPNGVMSSAVSLPNHKFTGQA